MEQERVRGVEPLHRQQINSRYLRVAHKHPLSASENKRLDGNENFVEQFISQHKSVHCSSAEHGNALVRYQSGGRLRGNEMRPSTLAAIKTMWQGLCGNGFCFMVTTQNWHKVLLVNMETKVQYTFLLQQTKEIIYRNK